MTALPRHIIEDILKTIKNLRISNTPESYISIKNTFKLFSIPVPIITIPAGRIFYRIRIHEEMENNVMYKRIQNVSHRVDRNGIKKFGRANEPFQSIFYCSDERETAFCETSKLVRENDKKEIEDNSLSIWRTKREINVATLPKDKDFFGNKTVESLNKDFNNLFKQFNNEDSTNLQYFLYRIAEEFSEHSSAENFNYLITCAFANYIYETPMTPLNKQNKVEIDGICYPSVHWKSKGMNFALKPELIEKRDIELVKIVYNKMQLFPNKTYFPTTESISRKIDYENWKIIWDKMNED